jgi:diguanylate cyclase (GGDEF)-like protein/PAS domain S-box-containing protein
MHMPNREPGEGDMIKRRDTGGFRSLSDPETLAIFAQNLKEGIYITTETGEILDANPAFLEIFGVETLDEMKRHLVSEFVDVDVRKREIALLERAGSLRSRELEVKRLDGTVRTVLDTWYSCRDPDTGATLFHGILVDITPRKNLETQLIEQSIRDPLTGCYNRREFANLQRELDGNDDGMWGCIYVDIDHFKQYNDSYGHAAGDKTLVKMSRFLMRHVRAEEPVIRMGGDEFLIVFRDTDLDDVERVARRMQAAAINTAPVSFTIGWAARKKGESFEDTVNRADAELIAVRVVKRPGTYTRRTPQKETGKTA